MNKFKEYLGEERFSKIKSDFLDALSEEKHVSKTIVKFIVARNE
jgi:hypothetical protein